MKLLNLKNLQCPNSLIKLKNAICKINKDELLMIITLDKMAYIDFKVYLDSINSTILEYKIKDNNHIFLIKK